MTDCNVWTPVAVVGCGYWGQNLVRNFAGLGVLAGIVDTDEAAAAALTGKYGGRALTFAQALADGRIGGIVIAAPAALHFKLASEALAAGKHVFVEKPLAMNVPEAERLCALAKAANLRLMVGHLLQYHPAYAALRQFVSAGKLGRITYVYSNRLSFGKIRREEDVSLSFAPHDVSMILGLVGEEPSSVGVFAAPVLHPAIADHAQLHLAFPGGAKGHVFTSWLHPVKEHRLVVAGDAGMAVFEDSAADPARKLLHYPHSIAWNGGAPSPVKGEAVPIPYGTGEPLELECRHFLDCIAQGRDPISDGEEGVRVLRVLARTAAAPAAGVSNRNGAGRFTNVMIHESAYVDDGVDIGPGSKIWHFSHILGRVKLGRNVVVGQNVVIGPDVTIGDNCKIQNNVSLYRGVTLEDGVFCGPSCVFTNVMNPRAEVERKSEFRPTLVKRGATIGANATIVCDHTIGNYAFIGAGSVVTRDVPDFAIMTGVPARRTGWVSRHGEKLGKDLVCPATGIRYKETGANRLEEISP